MKAAATYRGRLGKTVRVQPAIRLLGSTTQASEGLLSGLGIDLKSALSGFIGGKAATPSVCQSSAAPVADSSDAE